MNNAWQNIFGKTRRWFSKLPILAPKKNGDEHAKMDKLLALNLARKRLIPTWQQFKLIGKFLEPAEKKAIGLLFLVAVAGTLSWGVEMVLRHRTIVPQIGGEYSEGIVGNISALNPLYITVNQTDADLTRLIYAGLFRYDEKLNLAPDLAESYQIDATGKIFTVKIKKNLRWQDGEPITAEDVGFTLQRAQDPESQSPLWISFQGVEFNKIDDFNFTLTLPEPFAPFTHLLTTGILPEHLWQEVAPANTKLSNLNLKPLGAGSFMFSTFNKDTRGNIKSYTLKPNPYYHGEKPFIQTLIFKFYNDWPSAIDALHNRQVKGLGFLPKDQKEKISRRSLKINTLRLPYYSALFFNGKKNLLFKSQPLKQALALAIDKNQLITTALKGDGVAINGPILPGQVGYTRAFWVNNDANRAGQILDTDKWLKINREEFLDKKIKELYQEWLDAEKAKQTAAGATKKKLTAEEQAAQKKSADEKLAEITKELEANISPQQNVFRHKNNYGLTIKITTLNQPEFSQTAALIKEAWQDLGAQVTLELLEQDQLKDAIKNRNYEVLLYGVLLGADPDPFPFWHSSQTLAPGLNLSGFANRQADDLLEKARATYDAVSRAKLYYDFQKILSTELPAIFLYSTTYLYPTDSSVMGFNQYRIFQPADRFNGINNWYILTKSRWK